jgi:hypothetical protein
MRAEVDFDKINKKTLLTPKPYDWSGSNLDIGKDPKKLA